ncbi:hypothetical protein EJF36_03605 [Bacillus sp. HMF5848]|uniref:nitroreductase family protein n=1 Tax=Bacillus sp. HMF5848 TaxID=2495421 RepID=UPI000F7B7179|nr:nitroreductase family protein [Bacillus sp. HMF5848]RSK26031.1 hypothetical protein EJF36_03605 [Bacillus sp. HMF5848]
MAECDQFIPLHFIEKTPKTQQELIKQYVTKIKNNVATIGEVTTETLEALIRTAGSAPSGANQQPWSYVIVKKQEIKNALQQAAYQEGLTDTAFYIKNSQYTIVLFKQQYGFNHEGKKIKHYYPTESTAISAGFLFAALKHADINFSVHVPIEASHQILKRNVNEIPFLLFTIKGSDVNSYTSAVKYYEIMKTRRNVRDYKQHPVDSTIIAHALEAAAYTPKISGVSSYRFIIETDPVMKARIREQAEVEEKKLYEERISHEWRQALKPLNTNWQKPHLTDATFVITVFRDEQQATTDTIIVDSQKTSITMNTIIPAGMAAGIFLSGIHHAGLCTLTYTPSPMVFLRELYNRPKTEMPILVLPVGYPADGCIVPNITKKPLQKILTKH